MHVRRRWGSKPPRRRGGSSVPARAAFRRVGAPGGAWKLEKAAEAGLYIHPSISVDESGGVHLVAWRWDEQVEGGALVLAQKKGNAWTTEPVGFVELYATDIVAADGVLHLVYPLPNGGGLNYVTRDVSGGWSEPETILQWEAYYPDLELDIDGEPFVAHARVCERVRADVPSRDLRPRDAVTLTVRGVAQRAPRA